MKEKWTTVSPPEHTQLYSPAGMRLMLEASGFSKIKLKTEALNPTEIIRFYKGSNVGGGDDRVASAYSLNEKFTRSRPRRLLKKTITSILDLFEIGDSIKIFAEKG
jgi:hypothetical protein